LNAFRILIDSSSNWNRAKGPIHGEELQVRAETGMPVRVLMIVENFPYMSDPRVRNESRTLAANGYQVSVICPAKGREPWHEIAEGVSIYRFWHPHFGGHVVEYSYALLAIAALTLLVLLKEGFDVIHVANPPDYLVPLCAVYGVLGKLIVYDQHDLCPELYVAKFGENRFVCRLLLWLEKLSYRLADYVIIPNESYKEVALQRGGLPESKLTVVRNGPELKTVSTKDIDLEIRKKASTIIAYAGVIASQDGVDYLCRALQYLRYTLAQEDFYCVVIGDGAALGNMKELSDEIQMDEKICFTGWVSDPRLYARYLSTADICVAPEPANDYNGRSTFVKILEYMVTGKPIVAFDLLETRRSAEGAALYAKPNDVQDFAEKLSTLMANPQLRQSMGEFGRDRVNRQMGWQYSAPNLLTVYNKILRESGKAVSLRFGEAPGKAADATPAGTSSRV
jgi:glycosyltransferase involved in cell wall biosynthesis